MVKENNNCGCGVSGNTPSFQEGAGGPKPSIRIPLHLTPEEIVKIVLGLEVWNTHTCLNAVPKKFDEEIENVCEKLKRIYVKRLGKDVYYCEENQIRGVQNIMLMERYKNITKKEALERLRKYYPELIFEEKQEVK